ncbi:Rhomboid-like protein {ECO:0000256/RuleBase:RU362115} {ECO:0000256/RuleBase:RU362115} [Serendipita indica DSM 11827]|nr:Rhomboid-like protein {ECO:0000256/RuleBase:RU362115} {ECO:0000256/RuleBase:RU362115} [Serendipita indica DSM 11827]
MLGIRCYSGLRTAFVKPSPSWGRMRQVTPLCQRFYSPRSHPPHSTPERASLELEKERSILQEPMFSNASPKPRIAVPILFALLVSGLGFGVAAVRTNEETEKWRERISVVAPIFPWGVTSQSATMYGEWRQAKGRAWQEAFDNFQKKTVALPATVRSFFNYAYYYVAQSWVNLTEGKEMSYKLVGCFAAVYVMGLIPVARQFAHRAFSHDPLSGRVTTLFTSQFGHAGLLHMAVNSFALLGFGEFAWSYLRHKQVSGAGKMDEALSGYHFLAFHLAAGTVAALTSHLFAARVLVPRMMSAISKGGEVTATQILPSTGASGAIWASLMVTALGWPHTTVTLVFLPFFPISIGTGVYGLVALDIIGLIRGWRFFDHAGHLGGAAFGALYFYYGPGWWEWCREQAARLSLSRRSPPPGSTLTVA